MKKQDPDCLIVQLVKANTTAMAAIVAQMGDLVGVATAMMRQQMAHNATVARTRRMHRPADLLAEMRDDSITPVGSPPGVPRR